MFSTIEFLRFNSLAIKSVKVQFYHINNKYNIISRETLNFFNSYILIIIGVTFIYTFDYIL
jgi:hypothetical protein